MSTSQRRSPWRSPGAAAVGATSRAGEAAATGASGAATPQNPPDQDGGQSEETKVLMKAIKLLMEKSTKPEEKEIRAPQPSPFKGNPEDLERFLRQLENVFALEARSFKDDV